MLTKGTLRLLIATDILLIVVAVIGSFMGEGSLPKVLREYEQGRIESELTASSWILVLFSVPLVLAFLGSTIGLLAFWWPARPLYLVANVLGIALLPFDGPYISLGWVQAISDASLILSGVLLGVIYFSPLKTLYDRPQRNAEAPPG